jgi:hypothetical protein
METNKIGKVMATSIHRLRGEIFLAQTKIKFSKLSALVDCYAWVFFGPRTQIWLLALFSGASQLTAKYLRFLSEVATRVKLTVFLLTPATPAKLKERNMGSSLVAVD